MPSLSVMPHPDLCPQRAEFEVEPDEVLCDALIGRSEAD